MMVRSHHLWFLVVTVIIIKGKAVPLQAWSGPEGSRKLRFPDFMTTAQDGGKVVSLSTLTTVLPRSPIIIIIIIIIIINFIRGPQ